MGVVTIRAVQRSGIPAAAIFVCGVMDKMIAVEYDEEARFFHQRVILRVASIAAMFYTSKEMDDPPNGRFWTLTPDGDVYPEML